MATKLIIPITSGCEFNLGKEQYYMAIASIFRLPFDKLPLDANLRRAKKKAKVIQDMLNTLENAPQDFLKLNFGIVLIAERAHINYTPASIPVSLHIEMLSGLHGVANGGHTLEAIRQADEKGLDLTDAYVAIRVNVGVSDDSIKTAVVGLNSHENVDRRSILNKFGYLDNLKETLIELGYNSINYYQNQAETESRRDEPRQNIFFVIRLLQLIDKTQFDPIACKHPIPIAVGGTTTCTESAIKRAEHLALKFLPTIVKIDKIICRLVLQNPKKLPGVKTLKENEKFCLLTDNTPIPIRITSTFAFPIIAAFRAFIDDDEWKIPIDDLLEDIVQYLYRDYAEILRKEWNRGQSFTGLVRGQEVWNRMYNLSSKYYEEYITGRLKEAQIENGKVPKQLEMNLVEE